MAQADERDRYLQLGLEDDQLFQKYIAASVIRERELEIGTTADVNVGFVTGFDDKVVWLVSTENDAFPAVLIGRSSITSIKETGTTIEDYEDRPDSAAKKLREITSVIRRKADRELNRK